MTTGLDSFMAEAVCTLLRKLANTGKIVVCVIHQPSSDTFNLFTHLCLLAKGRTAYLGELSKAVEYFAATGHPCPPAFNPADFFIEELAIIPSDYAKSFAKLRVVTDAYQRWVYPPFSEQTLDSPLPVVPLLPNPIPSLLTPPPFDSMQNQ